MPTRRTFVLGAAGLAVTPLLARCASHRPAPMFLAHVAKKRLPAGGGPEPLRLACIGVGNRGWDNVQDVRGEHLVALCDVDAGYLARAGDAFPDAVRTSDYRELIEHHARIGIDGVVIATPDHTHFPIARDALRAGLPVYCEKPLTHTLAESRRILELSRAARVPTQLGTQIHAGENYRRVVEWIRSGKLGPVSVVRTFNVMNQGPDGLGHAPQQDPPPGLDWDLWLGPLSERPYNSLMAANSYNHCSFWDCSGGWTPGMAPHIIDLPIWALDLGVPLVTSCSGGRYVVRDDGDAPDTQEILWQYPNVTMTWMMSICNSFAFDFGRGSPARRLGIYFHALRGTLFTDYGKHEVVPEGNLLEDAAPPERSLASSPGHEREWLDCIKTRQQPSCNVNYHYKVDLALTLGNLAYKLGRSVRFDPQTEKIIGDEEAVKLARPVYRDPWKFPAEYLPG